MGSLFAILSGMSLTVLGISHQTAPIDVRERLAVAEDQLDQALHDLSKTGSLNGCVIVSTCNRTELYLSGGQTTTQLALKWLHRWHGLAEQHYDEHFYRLEQPACVFHLIKVISGADSMVLGEPQVAGQVKRAWQRADQAGTLDSELDRMFQHAFAAAKRVRSETGIGRDPVTLPFAALRLARQIYGSLDQSRVLLLGAGEMIAACAEHFHNSNIHSLTILNRNPDRAEPLARRFNADVDGLDRLAEKLPQSDLVIACTASPDHLLDRQQFATALKQRRHRPIMALDLSVPRNIDPRAGELGDLFLYTIDDLRSIIEHGQRQRQEALHHARQLIEDEVRAFENWLRRRTSNTAIKDLRERAQVERDALLEQALEQLRSGTDPEAVLQRFGHRLVNRLLHVPSLRMRKAAEQDDSDLIEAGKYFFTDGRQ